MNLLDPIKKIVIDRRDYLMNRTVLGEAFYGLLKYLDLVETKINSKQDKLVAGANITITGNTISSTGGGGGTVTSVALAVPTPASPAFGVSGSPVTGAGTLTITALGTTLQYIRGDGSLATFPAIPAATTVTGRAGDINVVTSGSNYEVQNAVMPFLLMGC
jgi:hypothetical protein